MHISDVDPYRFEYQLPAQAVCRLCGASVDKDEVAAMRHLLFACRKATPEIRAIAAQHPGVAVDRSTPPCTSSAARRPIDPREFEEVQPPIPQRGRRRAQVVRGYDGRRLMKAAR